jgi:hypothetical protein
MSYPKLTAALIASALAIAPGIAQARTHHHHHHRHHHHHHVRNYGLPYQVSFMHNYGPGLRPGTFAYYDGPSTNFCAQGAATYIGQNHRKHPCF